MEVTLYPDYVIYQGNCYTGASLAFSHNCIKINVSNACGKEGASDLDWSIDDVVDVRCNLFQSVSFMAQMKLGRNVYV